jgi:hypothetical protein
MPGTWFGRQGLTRPGILNVDFAVGDGIIPAASSSSSPNAPLTVQLICFRKDSRHELQEGDNLDTTLDKIRNVGEDWPTKGTLVVQLNIEGSNGRSWLPYELEKGALNVTPSITQGNNTMRLIHLSDLSDFTFVLYALSPELPRGWSPGGDDAGHPKLPSQTQRYHLTQQIPFGSMQTYQLLYHNSSSSYLQVTSV